MARFDLDSFVADCEAAQREDQPVLAVRAVLDRALSDPVAVGDVLQPGGSDIAVLHASPDLTVLGVVWSPGVGVPPHNHRMWAAIGVYAGQEDNAYFRRTADALEETGGRELREGEVLLLGDDAIHSVRNRRDTAAAAIHVYGGDFLHAPRSEWDPVTMVERPYDMARMQAYLRGEDPSAPADDPAGGARAERVPRVTGR
jgi:predicted metal-dependent enzyme (double-stranded beta helix superfamily)